MTMFNNHTESSHELDMELIVCERCGVTTTDPDLWDPEYGTGAIYCNRCWTLGSTR